MARKLNKTNLKNLKFFYMFNAIPRKIALDIDYMSMSMLVIFLFYF